MVHLNTVQWGYLCGWKLISDALVAIYIGRKLGLLPIDVKSSFEACENTKLIRPRLGDTPVKIKC